MVLHRWLYVHYILENTHLFYVRTYGLIAIVILSIVFGFIVDNLWRCWFLSSSSTRRCKNGYTVTELNSELSLAEEGDDNISITSRNDNNNNDVDDVFCENDVTQNRGESFELRSLSPGKPIRQLIGTTHSVKKVLLELEISNGRPVLFDDYINDGEDEDEDSNTGPTNAYTTIAATQTVAKAMRNVATAQRPGVFYCGTKGLLDTIKSGVNTIQRQRRNDDEVAAGTNNGPFNNCVFYEESFEM